MDGTIEYVNPRFLKLQVYKKNEIVGKNANILNPLIWKMSFIQKCLIQ